ncbi:hypothetical protein S7711_01637 [Stachybotrys chartarum IBT 7711]|uniref:Beta-lactamase-related domain-containing protein n=1 Tax=Stachybotrys chartarum (strain CBS 109288 / IBT 7711) TaxID=1280523 RepID=A0A084BCB8_STACB|nr:hypothetical protein S7711_01637 [Stachybotrys chartarum IBT 7711]KFA80021.1 hypothetical protein S40288_01855 [Stachybotrys chartarum IBT 40288]
MASLDQLLTAYTVGANDTSVYGALLGVGFQVYNETGLVYSGQAGRQGFDLASPAYDSFDSVQWIASMTKLITATLLLQLIDRGLVTLFEDLRQRIPYFQSLQILRGYAEDGSAILEDNTAPLSLRNLLTHTSGFPYDFQDPNIIRWQQVNNRTEDSGSWTIEGYTTPLVFNPSQGWRYGTSLDWAGIVLEAITNQTLAEYAQEHIFDPLGMTSTSFENDAGNIPNIAERQVDWAEADPTDSMRLMLSTNSTVVPSNPEIASGGSGLSSTTADYGKFLQATLRGDLVSHKLSKAMFKPQLNAVERGTLQALASGPRWYVLAPEIFPAGAPLDWGLSGLINLQDSPGRRRAGSLSWSGLTNGRWWIDRTSGIAAVMTTQILPPNYPLAIELFTALEEAVYRDLV